METLIEGEELLEEASPLSAERRVLAFIALTSALAGLVTCFPYDDWEMGTILALAYSPSPYVGLGVHLVGVGLMLLLAYRLAIRAFGTLSLGLMGGATAVRALPMTFNSDQSVKAIIDIGQLGLFGTAVVLVTGHLPRHRIPLAILTGGAAYALARLTPSVGLYTFIPRIEAGLLVCGIGYLGAIPLLFHIPDLPPSAEIPRARGALWRLRLLVLGTDVLLAMLLPLALRAYPSFLSPQFRVGNLIDFFSDMLPGVVLAALFLWRIPDRLGAALRITTGTLILVIGLAWFVPATRVPIHYAAWNIGGVATALAAYIAARAVRTQVRLPIVVGLGTIGWAVQLFFFRGYILPEPVIGGILAVAAVSLVVLLVLPTAIPAADLGQTSTT